MRRYNRVLFLIALVMTLLIAFLLYGEDVDGWRLPAIMLLVFAAIYGTGRKTY